MFDSQEFKEEMLQKKYDEETGSMAEERARLEAEEHRVLMAWNEEENQRLLKLRWDKAQNWTVWLKEDGVLCWKL